MYSQIENTQISYVECYTSLRNGFNLTEKHRVVCNIYIMLVAA